MKTKGKINWRSFYAESKFRIAIVDKISIATIVNNRVVLLPADPSKKAYLWAEVRVRTSRNNYNYPASLLIDVESNQWTYVHFMKVVNWPPRFRFTVDDKHKIYAAAKTFIEDVIKDRDTPTDSWGTDIWSDYR